MSVELHIQLKPDVVDAPEDILSDFPLNPDQSIIASGNGVIVINLGDADDTSYVQDWYLNENDDVLSFYVVED